MTVLRQCAEALRRSRNKTRGEYGPDLGAWKLASEGGVSAKLGIKCVLSSCQVTPQS